jgi:hypothetical protein
MVGWGKLSHSRFSYAALTRIVSGSVEAQEVAPELLWRGYAFGATGVESTSANRELIEN